MPAPRPKTRASMDARRSPDFRGSCRSRLWHRRCRLFSLRCSIRRHAGCPRAGTVADRADRALRCNQSVAALDRDRSVDAHLVPWPKTRTRPLTQIARRLKSAGLSIDANYGEDAGWGRLLAARPRDRLSFEKEGRKLDDALDQVDSVKSAVRKAAHRQPGAGPARSPARSASERARSSA